MSSSNNISRRLTQFAQEAPHRRAIVAPAGTDRRGRNAYTQITFSQLDEETDRLAAGLQQQGLLPGMKLVLFVPFSIEFVTLTFALLKAGAVIVLIDPGMGRRNIFQCLEEVDPDGFVAIPIVHLMRWLSTKRFPNARLNISVGRRIPGCVATDADLKRSSLADFCPVDSSARDRAAVIFTSGSTGPPKGVEYEHGMFDAQVELIRDFYGIQPGEIDLPGFPLFGLFNAAMGVTTVIPDMDPTKPAQVDPCKIIQAIWDQGVTQAFGSPAFWNRVGRYCVEHHVTLPSLRRALSAGGPVPNQILRQMSQVLTGQESDLHTPYGATESLPIASIGGTEVLARTAEQTGQGHGTCVGRRFPGIDVKIIEITPEPIATLTEATELDPGEIGEIIVSGPSVTRAYFGRPEATRLAKIDDDDRFWHRIGDVGYLDPDDLLWFCGRKAHLVDTVDGRLFSVCCEGVFNEHPRVYRSALVGIGAAPSQRPVIVIEPEPGAFPQTPPERSTFADELLVLASSTSQTASVQNVLFHPGLPVDSRHNVKINREQLALWATQRIRDA